MSAVKLIAAVVAFVCLESASAQAVQINCVFGTTTVQGRTSYGCTSNNLVANFTDGTQITVGGQHIPGQQNAGVNILIINGATINRFPNGIFNIFRNIEALEISNSGSFELNQAFRGSGNLLAISLVNNNLPVFPFAFFSQTPNLERVSLDNNRITDLGFAPFFGTRLSFISAEDNLLRVLPENTFNNLITLGEIRFRNNLIRALSGEIFRDNPALRIADFANNNIESIGSQLLNFLPNLQTLNLGSNQCVNQLFNIDAITTRPVINQALAQCFANPVPRSGAVLTFEVVGSMRIFDIDGNELLAVSG